METLTKSEVFLWRDDILRRVLGGEVFIHPTDTIYGLGCNATDEKAVKRIRQLKERYETPFSIWVPGKEWVKQNCVMNENVERWLKELPGPYTLVVKLRNRNAIARNVNPGNGTVGIRIPNHWFGAFVEQLGVPIITTSANRTGRMFMTSLEDLDLEVQKGVRFIVYEGEKSGNPSKIINLVEGEKVIVR